MLTGGVQMILVAAKPANVNGAFIAGSGLDLLGFRTNESPLSAFGVEIGPNMAVVPGRILAKPMLRYANNAMTADDRASWNLKNVKFHRGGRLERWAVMIIKDGGREEFNGIGDPNLGPIISGFSRMCQASGMAVDQQAPMRLLAELPPKNAQDPTRAAAVKAIQQAILSLQRRNLPKPKLMMVRGYAGFVF
jgi:eukaryotic translation initiation factor 2C